MRRHLFDGIYSLAPVVLRGSSVPESVSQSVTLDCVFMCVFLGIWGVGASVVII